MRENTHPLDQEEVMAYLDGELAASDATKAAEHLRECRECQELAADLQSVSRRVAEWQIAAGDQPMSPASVAALQQLDTKFAKESDRERFGWRKLFGLKVLPRLVWATTGAVAVIVILAFLVFPQRQYHTFAPSQQNGQSAEAASDLQAQMATGEGADRDRLRVSKSQVTSNMLYEMRPTTSEMSDSVTLAARRKVAGQIGAAVVPAPLIARTAQLTIIVKDFDTSHAQMQEILKRHRGYVGEMTTTAPEGADRKLTATLHVPAEQMDAAISEVKSLGRVESESQSGEEVTSQYIDLQARLTNARNTEQRLTELLRRQTGKLEEVVSVEEKISEVRGEIERMEAERKSLAQRVDFGTLSVSLTEQRKAQLQVVPPSIGTQFHNAAVEGYRSIVDGIVSLLLFLMSWGPSLLVWTAILFFPVRFAWRRVRQISS